MKVRVLLVDTNDEARASLAQRLLRSGDVELLGQARDAQEAALILGQNEPDVVLVDFHRGESQPLELCRGLRSMMTAPLAVLVSFMTQDRWQSLRAAGATEFLLKQVDTNGLGRALTELGKQYRAQSTRS